MFALHSLFPQTKAYTTTDPQLEKVKSTIVLSHAALIGGLFAASSCQTDAEVQAGPALSIQNALSIPKRRVMKMFFIT